VHPLLKQVCLLDFFNGHIKYLISCHLEALTPPTTALDKQLTGATFMVVMIDPDAPPLGLGGNGSQAFLHWMQDGLTSAATNVTIQSKTAFPLVNAANITAIQSYQVNNPNFTLGIGD
jgi:phosphatidylethanolamine-binding protein (PEBP) family uncharacterized protein